jgi:hypothetical protein
MNIWDLWAKSYRNTRAMAAALVLLLAILSLLSLRCNPMTDREKVMGLVLEIEAEGIAPVGGGAPRARVLLAAVDTAKVSILLPPPVPRPGDFIPLIAEHYRKGNTDYFLDLERWQIDGPQ